eukprot:gene34412-20752_t
MGCVWGVGVAQLAPRAAERAPLSLAAGRGQTLRAAGACSGGLLCGNVGCDGLLRYSFIGDPACWVHALERLATRWGSAAAANGVANTRHTHVTIYGVAKADAETAFAFRLRAAATM